MSMTHLGLALAAYQQKYDMENATMAKQIGITASTLSRIKGGTMPDAFGFAKVMIWLTSQAQP
jgi:DNA-binding XRE family transcriptional regulator